MNWWKTLAIATAALVAILVAVQPLYVVGLTLFDYGETPTGSYATMQTKDMSRFPVDDSQRLSELTARAALRDAGLEPDDTDVDNPFFDPAAQMPEARGLLWGGLLGALVGELLLFAMARNVFWIPRLSPVMTAGQYELVFRGLGLGAATGGFLGGVIGTYRRPPERDGLRIAVVVTDDRVGEVAELLREHGATTVESAVLYHEHPQQMRMSDSGTS